MSDVVIKVENLSKQYRLGVINHGTLAKDLQAWWAKKRGKEDPNSRISPNSTPQPSDLTLNPSPKGEGLERHPVPLGKGLGERSNELIYALRDINFEVHQGEVLGIIGSNGAGKSTLLKILSRVTSPTSGSIKIKGRIGSLLEVGTGFHPELTGRENIYLNGAILGMKRWEIDRKLAEIIDFSGVEKFIDTPVKRYSSGMYVRLAFAVAAHLDPEILVVDEVLAVGDAQFQKKCLGKMGDISKKEGRTVLFVSHNMGAIQNLCSRSIIVSKGKAVFDGITTEAIQRYSHESRKIKIDDTTSIYDEKHRRGSGDIRITSVSIQNDKGKEKFEFNIGDTIKFIVSWKCFKDMSGISVYIGFKSGVTDEVITSIRHVVTQKNCKSDETGSAEIEVLENSFRPGEYPLYIMTSESSIDSRKFDVLDNVIAPLVIMACDQKASDDSDPSRSIGYFSIKSKLKNERSSIC